MNAAEGRLARLNALPEADAAAALLDCCGSRAWAQAMAQRRPFRDASELFAVADEVWWALAHQDWLEAFRSHPRIGERNAARGQTEQARRWSAGEQAAVDDAADWTLRHLADANRAYEARFGHIFIVCASGRGAGEMLEMLHARLANEPADELRIAAEEQSKITRIRLDKLLEAP